MPLPLVIILTGLPATGKTTLGKRLAPMLGLPCLHKDGIKELLFERFGAEDREESRRLGRACYDLLYYFAEIQLAVGRSLMMESNFDPRYATQEFLRLKTLHPFEPFQILCKTDGDTLLRRFHERAVSGERHPAHMDHIVATEDRSHLLQGRLDPLEIGGTLLEVDTTDFATLDLDALAEAIRARLPRA
jgi:predicted kinase